MLTIISASDTARRTTNQQHFAVAVDLFFVCFAFSFLLSCTYGTMHIIYVLTKIYGVVYVGIGYLELHSGVNLTPIRRMCCIISSLLAS